MPLTYKDEQKIQTIVEASEERLAQKYDNVVIILDKVVGKLQAIRQEFTMVEGHKDQLEDHEERIITLESSKLATTS